MLASVTIPLSWGAALCCACDMSACLEDAAPSLHICPHEACCSSPAIVSCLQILASIIAGIGFGGYDYPVDGFGNCQFCRLSYRWGMQAAFHKLHFVHLHVIGTCIQLR